MKFGIGHDSSLFKGQFFITISLFVLIDICASHFVVINLLNTEIICNIQYI